MLDGKTTEAVVSFDRALKLDANMEEARLNRAIARLRLGDPAAASADLDAIWANEASRHRAAAAYHNGLALDRLGRPAEAERWLTRAATLDPKLDAALLYVGMLRERRGDLQGAGRAYLDYLKKHPDGVTALLHFALSAQKAGRIDVAKSYFERVIKAAPDSEEAIEARKYLVMWE